MRVPFKVSITVIVTLLAAAFGYVAVMAKAEFDSLQKVMALDGEYLFEYEVGQKLNETRRRTPTLILCLSHDVYAINLSGTEVDSSDLALLRHTPDLKVLWLANTNIDDNAINHLLGLKRLEELGVEETRISEVGERLLRAELPNTRVISIHMSPL